MGMHHTGDILASAIDAAMDNKTSDIDIIGAVDYAPFLVDLE
jgi:hypothetical protein